MRDVLRRSLYAAFVALLLVAQVAPALSPIPDPLPGDPPLRWRALTCTELLLLCKASGGSDAACFAQFLFCVSGPGPDEPIVIGGP